MAVVASRRSRQRAASHRDKPQRPDWTALACLGVLIFAAVLAFGAVDRIVQICLLAPFAVAVLLRPPDFASRDRRLIPVILGIGVVLAVKEFAPAEWFGATLWRTTLTSSYDVRLPVTHHPEPGRAVDALLTIALSVIWFVWVRTIAGERSTRAWIPWVLFGAAIGIAVVSFATKGIDAKAIYGMRFTPGWQGFGPFPNRNHSGSFFAMGTLLGAGCVVWAFAKKNRPMASFGVLGLFPVLAGLFETHSRGGLVSLGVGVFVFVGLVLWKVRSRRAVGAVLAGVLIATSFALTFGAAALSRFSSSSSEVSNASRVLIWKDTINLWLDAPILGHGAGAFTSVFPFYQTLVLDNQMVLHPESSWLQSLAEFGALPVLAVVVLVILFVRPHLRASLEGQSTCFLTSGAIAAVIAVLAHCLIDVPAHRWGTAAFAIAAFALICPATRGSEQPATGRKLALVPLLITALWSLPFFRDVPSWSPTTIVRAIDRAQAGAARPAELKKIVEYFPLNAMLHQFIGLQELEAGGRFAPDWERHFQIAVRLTPGSWATPMSMAQACRSRSPGHALYYWQMALERASWRRDELFETALSETNALSGAGPTWANYVESHPELLLHYARFQPSAAARESFERWWQKRAMAPDLEKSEINAFYRLGTQWASLEQIEQWVQLHPERQSSDFLQWGALFHARNEDQRAWTFLKAGVPEPSYPAQPPSLSIEQLEMTYRISPENRVNAQNLAQAKTLAGDTEGARKVIVEVARSNNAPMWFRQKAAYLLAAAGQISDAVALLLEPVSKAE